MRTFVDRRDAGRRIVQEMREAARTLSARCGSPALLARLQLGAAGLPGTGAVAQPACLVLALPRGGVPVGREVAAALGAPLDVWVARKLGAPHQPELGMGAIAEGEGLYWNDTVLRGLDVSSREVEEALARERRELSRRVERYRGDRPPPALQGKVVFVVDDGIATGGTLLAALQGIRRASPRALVVCVPVAPRDTLDRLAPQVDALVCPEVPVTLWSIGSFYQDFRQVSDDEVVAILAHQPWCAPPVTR